MPPFISERFRICWLCRLDYESEMTLSVLESLCPLPIFIIMGLQWRYHYRFIEKRHAQRLAFLLLATLCCYSGHLVKSCAHSFRDTAAVKAGSTSYTYQCIKHIRFEHWPFGRMADTEAASTFECSPYKNRGQVKIVPCKYQRDYLFNWHFETWWTRYFVPHLCIC